MLDRQEKLTEGKLRAVALVEAADKAALTPISVGKLHSLAYLADTLSPVWGLIPFDKVALKTDVAPFFGEFQEALDALVVEGLLEVESFSYEGRANESVLMFDASYRLRYDSQHLDQLISFLRTDEFYSEVSAYLDALAIAMSRLPDEEIAAATSKDASWENPQIPSGDMIEIGRANIQAQPTPTDAALALFDELKAKHISLSPSARLRLYATYLGQRLAAA